MASFKQVPPVSFNPLWGATFVVIAAIVLTIMDGFVAIPAGHVGVIYDYGRGIIDTQFDEGLHLKVPLWQKVTIMDGRTQEYTMSKTPGEGAVYNDDSIYGRSKDGQVVQLDATILYHIDRSKAHQIMKKIGDDREYRRKIVRPRGREVLREIVARHNALDLVSEKRTAIVQEMRNVLSKSFTTHHIVLEDVLLRNVTFSEEFAKAIEEKQVAFQKIKTAEYQKEEAEQRKQKKIIEAEADAEAIRLKAETLKNNPSVIQYEFVQKMAPSVKWGILPNSVSPLMDMKGMFQ